MKEFFKRLFGSNNQEAKQPDSPQKDKRKDHLVAIFNGIQSGAESSIIEGLEAWISTSKVAESPLLQEQLIQLKQIKQEKIIGTLSLQDFLERFSTSIHIIYSQLLHSYIFTDIPKQQILNQEELEVILETQIKGMAVPPFSTNPPFEDVHQLLLSEYQGCLSSPNKVIQLFSSLALFYQLSRSRGLNTLFFADDALHTHQILSHIWLLFRKKKPTNGPSSPNEPPPTQELSALILLEQIHHNHSETALQMIMASDRTAASIKKQADQILERLQQDRIDFQASRMSYEAYRIGKNRLMKTICALIDSMYPFLQTRTHNQEQHVPYFKSVKQKLNSGQLSEAFGPLEHILDAQIPVDLPILLVHASTETEVDALFADKKISEQEHLLYKKRAKMAYVTICNRFLPEDVEQEHKAVAQAEIQAQASVPLGVTLADAKEKLREGDVGLALLYIDKILVNKYGRNHPYRTVILLRSQFNRLEEDKENGVISEQTYLLQRNQLKRDAKKMLEGLDIN